MRLCNTDPQINCFTFSHLYVVVQLVWIAAFLVSTKFEHFRYQPPGKISYCCFGAPVLCTGALFCTLFLIRKRLRPYRCRSPPSDYPYYTQDMIVEVPDEVALLLREYMLLEEAYRIRTYRYKAFYSLDRDEGIEREILQKPLNPAEIWEQRQMTELIYKGLSKLPVKQRQRIYAHFFLGMSKADIAKAEGTHKSRITRSIEAGLRSLEKYFKEIL